MVVQTKGREVQVPADKVPMLKSLTIAGVPLGGVTLNWKVRSSLELESVAFALQITVEPSDCGEARDDVRDWMVTVA